MRTQDIFFIETVVLIAIYFTLGMSQNKFNLKRWKNEDIDNTVLAFIIINVLLLAHTFATL
jgi:hypothetical protein